MTRFKQQEITKVFWIDFVYLCGVVLEVHAAWFDDLKEGGPCVLELTQVNNYCIVSFATNAFLLCQFLLRYLLRNSGCCSTRY